MSKSKLLLAREALSFLQSDLHSHEYRRRLATDVREVLNLHDELVKALDAIVYSDSPENENAMIQFGFELLARIDQLPRGTK